MKSVLSQNNTKDLSSSLNKLSNIRSMILNENTDNFKGFSPRVKTSFENKFQSYESVNTCSPKNSFYLNSLNSSNMPTNNNNNKNDLQKSVLYTDANYNSQNASKMRNSFEILTNDLFNSKGANAHSSSKSKFNRDNNFKNNQNSNPNIYGYSSGNSQAAYQDLLYKQQENRFAKMKKEKIFSLLEEKKTVYDFKNNSNYYIKTNNNNNKLSPRNSTEKTLGKNYFSSNAYTTQAEIRNNNLENSRNYNSILHENPEIRKRIEVAVGNPNNNNGFINNKSWYNIQNFGLVPTSKNSSSNFLINYNNMNTNAGKEFSEFLHASKNKQNKDFHHNFINSPAKNIINNKAVNRNSLRNLNAVKSQLENLFERNDRNDKGNNNAMDNLCAFLNFKNKKASVANVQQTDKSVKLMEEIKDMR